MMNRIKWIILVLVGLLSTSRGMAAEPSWAHVDSVPGLPFELSFDLEPAGGSWTPDSSSEEGRLQFQSEQGYRLSVAADKKAGYLKLELSRDKKQEFRVRSYTLRFRVPVSKLGGVWHAQMPVHNSLFLKPPDVEFHAQAAANVGMPFILCADTRGNTLAGVGWLDQILRTDYSARLINQGHDLQVELTKNADSDSPLPRKSFTEGIFARTGDSYWFDSARDYAHSVDKADGFKPEALSPAMLEPLFISYSDELNQARIWQSATQAKDAGFGAFMVGAGWSTPSGGAWGDAEGPYGDYHPAERKFSDFSGLIGRMQKELGLRVMLWTAPFWVGRASNAQTRLQVAKLITEKGEDHNLCPRHELTKAHLANICSQLMEDYKPDGLRLDFMDSLPTTCAGNHVHMWESSGQGYVECIRAMADAIRKKNPDAMIGYRLGYANPISKFSSNLWGTAETPRDAEQNRLLGIMLRVYGDGIAIQPDPVPWKPGDSEAILGARCAAMFMGGIPSFSQDLSRLPETQLKLLKAWLGFYREHREDLQSGEFRPFGADYGCPDIKIESKNAAFVYLRSNKTRDIPISNREVGQIYLFNATDTEDLSLNVLGITMREISVSIRGPQLQEVATEKLRATVEFHPTLKIPRGGVAVLSSAPQK